MNLLDAVSAVLNSDEDVDQPVMVTGFVLLAEFVDDEGASHIYADTFEGQSCHETLGLLTYAVAVETRRAADHVLGDDE